MSKLSFKEIINALIKVSYLGALVAPILVFSFGYEIYDVFNLPKVSVFKIFTILLWVFTIIKFSFLQKIKLPKFKHLIGPLVLVVTLLLVSIMSAYPELSFGGAYQRAQGWFFYVYLFLFLLGVSINILNFKHKLRIKQEMVGSLMISGVVVSIYAILQVLGIDFIDWPKQYVEAGRVFANLGQPNFLGLFLLLVLPLPLFFYRKSNSLIFNLALGVVIIVNLIALYFTYSRSAWIGLLLLLLLSPVIFYSKKQLKKIVKISGLVLGIIVVVGISLYTTSSMFKHRIDSVTTFDQGSVAIRLKYWTSAWKGVKEKPILGYGLDTQKEVLITSYDKEYSALEEINSYSNRAHNYILDILLTSGVLGLIAYIFFYFKLFSLSWNSGRLGKIFSVSVLAYIVALMFLFEIVVTQIIIWAWLAWFIAEDERNCTEFSYNLLRIYKIIIIGAVILVSAFILKTEVSKLKADHFYNQMTHSFQEQDYLSAWVLYDYIQDNNPKQQYYINSFIKLAFIHQKNFKTEAAHKKFQAQVETELETISEVKDFDSKLAKARAWAVLGKYNKSEEIFKKLIQLNQDIPFLYVDLARVYFKQDKYDLAVEYVDKAIFQLPELDSSLLNKPHREELSQYLAKLYIMKGKIELDAQNYDAAISDYDKALSLDEDRVEVYKYLADCYYLKGDISRAIWYNKQGKEQEPNNPKWWFNLSALYKKQGDDITGERYFKQAQKLNK